MGGPPFGGGGAPNPGFEVRYDPITKEVMIIFNAAVAYTFDYEGNLIKKSGESKG
jgi:hypothetical protein